MFTNIKDANKEVNKLKTPFAIVSVIVVLFYIFTQVEPNNLSRINNKVQEVFYSDNTKDYKIILEKIYSVNQEKNNNLPKGKVNKEIDYTILETLKKIMQYKENSEFVIYINEPQIVYLDIYKNEEYFLTICIQCQYEKNIVEIKIFDNNNQTKRQLYLVDDSLLKELFNFFL